MSLAKKVTTTVSITDSVLGTFRPSKALSRHDGASITSLDFDYTGQYLVSAGVDKSIQVYDCYKGIHHMEVQSQKYGAHLAKFTHNFECLYASTPIVDKPEPDHSVRYLSLSTKGYLRYFKGHKDQVLQLEMNPCSDTFLSLSADHTVKNWDLRTSSASGSIGVGANALVAFDPRGIVFVSATCDSQKGTVSFYDVNGYEKGPFLVSDVPVAGEKWTKIEFSNNGRYIVIGTNTSRHHILDAILGKPLAILINSDMSSWPEPDYVSTGSVCFTPDGKFVLSGMPNGNVATFDLQLLKSASDFVELRPYTVLSSDTTAAKVLAFNPKLLTFASADDQVVLWSTNQQ